MRLKASKDAGLKEVWIEVAEGLTEEQKKEFIVKDNVGFGEWEWDMLANEWDSVQLADWGLDVWQNEDDVEDIEEVIDFNEDVNFIIKCQNLEELEELKDNLKVTGNKTSYSKFKELLDL
jgi:hypothetical protein